VDCLRDPVSNPISIPATITWLALADLIFDKLLKVFWNFYSI
jgi:hypothetical protein